MKTIAVDSIFLRRAINEQDLKMYWVAEMAGVHKTTLRRWLSGRTRKIRVSHLKALAQVLELNPNVMVQQS